MLHITSLLANAILRTHDKPSIWDLRMPTWHHPLREARPNAILVFRSSRRDAALDFYIWLALEKSTLIAKTNTAQEDIADLKELMAAVFEEKEALSNKLVRLTATSTSEIAELQARLAEQEDQNRCLFEQIEAEGSQINLLLDTIVSIRQGLDAVETTASLEFDLQLVPIAECRPVAFSQVADALARAEAENSCPTESLGSQSPLPANTFVDETPGPWNGIGIQVEHESPVVHATGNVNLEGESEADGTPSEHLNPDVVESDSDPRLISESLGMQTIPQADEGVPVLSVALPMSPPITPPNNSKALFDVNPENAATSTNTASMVSSSYLWEPMSPGNDSTPCPSPARSPFQESPTAGPSRQTSGTEARRKPPLMLFSALRAARASTTPSAPSVMPALSEGTSVANSKPHSWDVRSDRVYPPEYNAESPRGSGRPAMDYGPNWHRPKPGKPS